MDKALIEAIREASPENRISCTKARELSERFGITLSEIGSLANELKIKIVECELGCF
ncbi:MAG: hypothetical protein AABY44_06055 [Nitrospirota bacterium]